MAVTLIVVGPDADTAERNLGRLCEDMRGSIRQSFAEYHDMVEAQRAARQ